MCMVSKYQIKVKAHPHTRYVAMKCIYGKPTPSWDIRITCNNKSTKMEVYNALKDQLVDLHRHNDTKVEVVRAALVTPRLFAAKETDDVDISVVATTDRMPVNPHDFWKRKLSKARVYIGDKKFEDLDLHAQVVEVDEFTRLSARRFCWSHADSKEEIEAATKKAIEAEPTRDELLSIMPEVAILGPENDHMAPAIWALMNVTQKLQPQPALMDCDHKWWNNPKTYRWDEADIAAKL